LVTGAAGDGGIGVIRELAAAGHEVAGADTTRLPFGLRSRYLKSVHRLPLPTDCRFDESLVALVRVVQPDVFLPLGSHCVRAAGRQVAELSRHTALVVPTQDAFLAAFDHAVCAAECAELQIPCPAVYTPEEALARLSDGGRAESVVVKPRTDKGEARGVSYVRGPDALRRSLADCTARFGGAIVQEYIPGDTSAMRTVVLLFDKESRLLAAFTTCKLRQWPPTGGVTALSISTAEAPLVESVLPFFHRWRWRGFAEVELKVDRRDGVAKVIEINPRNPGYLRFPIVCGLPLGRLAVAAATGEAGAALPFPSYAVGRRFANLELVVRSVAAEIRTSSSKTGVVRGALADLKGTGGFLAGFLVDPAPPLGRVLLAAGRGLRGRGSVSGP